MMLQAWRLYITKILLLSCVQVMVVAVVPHHHHHHHVCMLSDLECAESAHSASHHPSESPRCESCCITKFHAVRQTQKHFHIQVSQVLSCTLPVLEVRPVGIRKTGYAVVKEKLFASLFCRRGGCRAPPVV